MPRATHVMSKDPKPNIGLYSYGTKGGARPQAQFDIDVSKWRDPGGQIQWRGRANGTETDVRNWVAEDPRTPALVQMCAILAADLIAEHTMVTDSGVVSKRAESPWMSIAFHDHHGRWAAPAVAEIVADFLDKAGYTVCCVHHGLVEKKGKVVL